MLRRALPLFLAGITAVLSFVPSSRGGPHQSTTELGASYLDSLASSPSQTINGAGPCHQPATFGELLGAGDINDPSAFAAASSAVSSHLASSGYVTAAQIREEIDKVNSVVSEIRRHFPGALGSSEILRRTKAVLDGMGVENILLTQSVCPDEINHEEVSHEFRSWQQVFLTM